MRGLIRRGWTLRAAEEEVRERRRQQELARLDRIAAGHAEAIIQAREFEAAVGEGGLTADEREVVRGMVAGGVDRRSAAMQVRAGRRAAHLARVEEMQAARRRQLALLDESEGRLRPRLERLEAAKQAYRMVEEELDPGPKGVERGRAFGRPVEVRADG